jgi:hypothetical protein
MAGCFRGGSREGNRDRRQREAQKQKTDTAQRSTDGGARRVFRDRENEPEGGFHRKDRCTQTRSGGGYTSVQ